MGKSFVEKREKAIEIIRNIGHFLFAAGSVASASTLGFQAGYLRREPRFLPSVLSGHWDLHLELVWHKERR